MCNSEHNQDQSHFRHSVRTSFDYIEYFSTWVEYKNFYTELSSVHYRDVYFTPLNNEGIVLMCFSIIFQTLLTLHVDKMPRHLCGPYLNTQIHAYLATCVTNLTKWETVILITWLQTGFSLTHATTHSSSHTNQLLVSLVHPSVSESSGHLEKVCFVYLILPTEHLIVLAHDISENWKRFFKYPCWPLWSSSWQFLLLVWRHLTCCQISSQPCLSHGCMSGTKFPWWCTGPRELCVCQCQLVSTYKLEPNANSIFLVESKQTLEVTWKKTDGIEKKKFVLANWVLCWVKHLITRIRCGDEKITTCMSHRPCHRGTEETRGVVQGGFFFV